MINPTFYPGQNNVDPFAAENIELSAEQIAGNQRTPRKITKTRKTKESLFVQYPYDAQMALAKQTRNCLIAVQAELHRLYFQKWDKTEAIELGNCVLRSLGFDNKQKKRALEALETAEHIKVQWRGYQSPLITLTDTGFRLISGLGSAT
jgi:hypothetical protein